MSFWVFINPNNFLPTKWRTWTRDLRSPYKKPFCFSESRTSSLESCQHRCQLVFLIRNRILYTNINCGVIDASKNSVFHGKIQVYSTRVRFWNVWTEIGWKAIIVHCVWAEIRKFIYLLVSWASPTHRRNTWLSNLLIVYCLTSVGFVVLLAYWQSVDYTYLFCSIKKIVLILCKNYRMWINDLIYELQ